ncbi:transcription factor SPT20 homolog isoform X1 [Pteropus medius]|uniref:transcription factor SPT20 homolog isoform X1 n=1 Tax=Pteropus vampyrus TaxID=132908 RepID=UPI00196A8212|nr:transcription factor SPT20 homolog isoform X1 [Pteropus giganteus]
MQRALEQALDRADYVIESAQQRPPKRKYSSSGRQTLYEKLYDIYVEECGKEPKVTEELTSNVNLLEKLVKRESLPCLVVNLYPGREGYSLMLKGKNGSCSEPIRLSYEKGELLEYLDAEELPPVLVDFLEKAPINLFHCGCVIAEIRDYRQCSNTEGPRYQSRHILLRPTMQTLACDVESIVESSGDQTWTQDDKLLLESQLILATAEPLCLDPSISVACAENRLLFNRQKMNSHPMRRNFKRYSTASLNRRQEMPPRPLPPELSAWTACKKIRERQAGQQYDLKISKGKYVDMWKRRPCELAVPSEVDVEKYAKGKRSVKRDDSQPAARPALKLRDGSALGREAGAQSQATEPTFVQPLNDPLFSAQRRSRKEAGRERQMSPCHFSTDDYLNSYLCGPKTDAGRVVGGSEELAQKNNTRIPVKTSPSPSPSASATVSRPPGEDTEQPQAVPGQPSALGRGVQHAPPAIRLPSSSGKSSSGNSLPPQRASSLCESPFPAPASRPPSLSQESSVGANRVSTLPAASQSAASSSPRTPATQVRASPAGLSVVRVVGPVGGAQTAVRGSNPEQGPAAGASAPAGVRPSSRPANARPAAPQAPSQRGVRFFLKTASGLRPLTLVRLPQGSFILNTQQPAQQPAQQPQQWLCQLMPEQEVEQPSASRPQEPVPRGSGAQGSASQRPALSARQAVLINLSETGRFLQAETAVLCQRGCAQTGPGQGLPQQRVQPSPASQQPLQPRQVQLRIVQHRRAVARAAAPTAQPGGGQQTASQSEGDKNGGPPSTPDP